MIPHEAFDLSTLNDGDGVGSHFGDGFQLWRSYLARRRALLRTVLHFWHWKTKTRMACWSIVLDIDFISGRRVDDFTRHSNRVAGHGQCDAR